MQKIVIELPVDVAKKLSHLAIDKGVSRRKLIADVLKKHVNE